MTSEYDKDAPRSDVYREAYLYDLDSDPHEMVNLAGLTVVRGIADELKARLLAWIAEIDDGHAPQILNAEPRYSRQYRLKPTDLQGFSDAERPIEPPVGH